MIPYYSALLQFCSTCTELVYSSLEVHIHKSSSQLSGTCSCSFFSAANVGVGILTGVIDDGVDLAPNAGEDDEDGLEDWEAFRALNPGVGVVEGFGAAGGLATTAVQPRPLTALGWV